MNHDDVARYKLEDISHEFGLCQVIVAEGYDKFIELSPGGKANRRMAGRAVENVAEASRKLPQSWKDSRSEVPWREIVAMRNKITHDFGEIDHHIVWEVIAKKFPVIADQLGLSVDADPFGRL